MRFKGILSLRKTLPRRPVVEVMRLVGLERARPCAGWRAADGAGGAQERSAGGDLKFEGLRRTVRRGALAEQTKKVGQGIVAQEKNFETALRPVARAGLHECVTQVLHPSGHRPFMRGIMIHALMERGIAHEKAVATTERVYERIRNKPEVTSAELASHLRELLGTLPPEEVASPLEAPTRILITGKGRLPFSKGFLSQSLLAAAIDPSEAFNVAAEIEFTLLRSRVSEIPRYDLRRMTYDTVKRRVGEEAARRFLIWRKFQDPEKPVIVLLGGSSGVGKTSLAVEVAHRLGIYRVLSTDSIRQVMRIMLSPALMPHIHASSYDAYRHLTFPPHPSVDPVIEGFKQQAAVVSVGVQAMIERAISEKTSMVLDGVSIVPGILDLEAYRDAAHIIFVMVAVLDTEAITSRFENRGKDQVLRKPHHYIENLDAILKIQDHLLQAADQHGVPIVDNKSFDRSVISLLRNIIDTLGQKLPVDSDALL